MIKLLKFLLQCSRGIPRSRASVALVIAVGLVAGVSNAALLALIEVTINKQTAEPEWLIPAFSGLCVLMFLARVASGMVLNWLAQAAMFELSLQLSRRILAVPLRRLEELGAARLLATLTQDVPVIANTLTTLPVLCMHMAVLAGCLLYLGWLSWSVLAAVLAFITLGVITYQLPMMSAVRYLKAAREGKDDLIKNYRAVTEGTKELKLNRTRHRSFFSTQLEPSADLVRRNQLTGNNIFTIAAGWGHLLIFVLIGLLFFALPHLIGVSKETLVAYVVILLYLMTPLEVILNAVPFFGQANVSAEKIQRLGLSLEQGEADGEATDADLPPAPVESLELEGVCHTYYSERDASMFTLGPIDLSFRPGEVAFLIGGNGSGKTTLIKLLMGLYVPEAGQIRLNGRAVCDGDREDYRQNFSAVFSDFFLFEDLARGEAADLEPIAREYLAQLQLDHKVRVEAGRFSTIDLSQGQRKRLALLTAYLEDRPVYVFDEWAADQEPLFKSVFYDELLPRLKARGKLVIVISHDDRYYAGADRLIKLEYGKVEYDSAAGPALSETSLPSRVSG